jgi:pimeloyl-ACP methyl ester carboxylesterase
MPATRCRRFPPGKPVDADHRIASVGTMYPRPRVVRAGGRVLTVEDTGPADGLPVLVHSGGGSRHLAPAAVRQAHAAGIRLVGYDRPSYGGSTPLPGRSVADCAPDVEAILRELGLDRIGVWGFSGGGPYALATAALLPERVAAVCVFAPLGPYGVPGFDFLAGMADGYREEVEIFFADRAAARARFRREGADLYARLSTPADWLRQWGERALTDEAHGREAAEYLASLYRDGWTRGDEGWWADWSAFLRPWGFDPADVAAPVRLWHGERDTRCPPAHSRWLAGRIPDVTAHFPATQDHTDIEDDNRPVAYAWLRGQLD